ncbi:TRAP transporter small permease [Ferruginivarius sediminum]|uniref:TRAP transporter small permease protein n=1 Tax=Ferruginivarius sediminum TaxID=2661937 RepID=A0A369TEI6_9PROT|nr:TRAP transporter small permease [Ferruginivarius sediminum]RDD62785.1 TRAP transporter small permease [Ferruginivarius sediminum]
MKHTFHENTAETAHRVGGMVNRLVERTCAALIAAMVVIVWLGVVSRYLVELGITWNEELARYVMIWAALLAVSAGVYRREHIGLELFYHMLPARAAVALRLGLDAIGFGFFGFLVYYGVGMTVDGMEQYATIFGMTMVVPFAAVPVSAGLAALQILLATIRDTASGRVRAPAEIGVS